MDHLNIMTHKEPYWPKSQQKMWAYCFFILGPHGFLFIFRFNLFFINWTTNSRIIWVSQLISKTHRRVWSGWVPGADLCTNFSVSEDWNWHWLKLTNNNIYSECFTSVKRSYTIAEIYSYAGYYIHVARVKPHVR